MTSNAVQGPQTPGALWVAPAWARLRCCASSTMTRHRLDRRALHPGPRRSQRDPRDFYHGLLGPDYRFPESTTRGVPLLKLHGSTNWIQCPECDQVVPWELGSFFDKYRWPFLDDVDSTKLDISQKFENIQHCDKPLPRKPFLVPPTWNKTDHQLAIGGVWRQAAKELTDAEHIFIIGYSIPETDAFDLPPGTSPLSKLDLGPFEVHSMV